MPKLISRSSGLIILVLSICAACLLAVAVPNRLSQTHEQRRMLAELKTLYESYGLRIELDELPRRPINKKQKKIMISSYNFYHRIESLSV